MAENDYLRSRVGPKWKKVFALVELQQPTEEIRVAVEKAQVDRLRESGGMPLIDQLVDMAVQVIEDAKNGRVVSVAAVDEQCQHIVVEANGNLNTQVAARAAQCCICSVLTGLTAPRTEAETRDDLLARIGEEHFEFEFLGKARPILRSKVSGQAVDFDLREHELHEHMRPAWIRIASGLYDDPSAASLRAPRRRRGSRLPMPELLSHPL